MPERELTVADHGAHDLRQIQEAEQIGDRRPFLPDRLGDFLLGQRELLDKLGVPFCLFDRIEIRALEVLDQGER